MVLWVPSDRASQKTCLAAKRDEPLSHDNLFHTVLGLVGVRAAEYKASLDLAACNPN
jgi:lipid A ethanolaminephosphotransferase